MHISYFLDFSIQGFFKSLMALPELNTQGATSKTKNIRSVPWGNQYRIGSDYWIATNEEYGDDEEYSSYMEEYEEDDIEEYVIEHLSHKGWVQI